MLILEDTHHATSFTHCLCGSPKPCVWRKPGVEKVDPAVAVATKLTWEKTAAVGQGSWAATIPQWPKPDATVLRSRS